MKVFWLWWTMEVICIQLSNLDVKNKWPPSYRKNFQKKKTPIGTKKEMGTKDIFKKMIRNVIQFFYHKVFEFNRSMFSILIFSFSCYLILNQK